MVFVFFFQAEDGIRDADVTGVQTCALPILVEHVAGLSRDRPVVLLCLGRPELVEQRPGWGGAAADAELLSLEPLREEDGLLLLEGLLGPSELDEAARRRVVRSADGKDRKST